MLKLSSSIKFIATDFDGVFTDCLVYIDENMVQQKKMSFKDIMGVSLALKNDFKIAVISGETSNILNYFKEKFSMDEIHKGVRDKGSVLKRLMEKYNLDSNEVLYIGDDINDIGAFDCVDYKIAPKNANDVVKRMQNMQITQNYGGDGAFREVIDCLLAVKNG
jgi:YrbI family 3-deoxy-D-manno-octulosonate 8-phosphate phosphatase